MNTLSANHMQNDLTWLSCLVALVLYYIGMAKKLISYQGLAEAKRARFLVNSMSILEFLHLFIYLMMILN